LRRSAAVYRQKWSWIGFPKKSFSNPQYLSFIDIIFHIPYLPKSGTHPPPAFPLSQAIHRTATESLPVRPFLRSLQVATLENLRDVFELFFPSALLFNISSTAWILSNVFACVKTPHRASVRRFSPAPYFLKSYGAPRRIFVDVVSLLAMDFFYPFLMSMVVESGCESAFPVINLMRRNSPSPPKSIDFSDSVQRQIFFST